MKLEGQLDQATAMVKELEVRATGLVYRLHVLIYLLIVGNNVHVCMCTITIQDQLVEARSEKDQEGITVVGRRLSDTAIIKGMYM